MNLKTLETLSHKYATADKSLFEIIDDETGKVVGHVKRLRDGLFQWDIDGCGSFTDTTTEALAAAQIEYDNQQLTARRQAETEELERQSMADSGDYVAGLLSTLKRVSEELIAEYHRDTRRPADIARHEAKLDKIKTELGE